MGSRYGFQRDGRGGRRRDDLTVDVIDIVQDWIDHRVPDLEVILDAQDRVVVYLPMKFAPGNRHVLFRLGISSDGDYLLFYHSANGLGDGFDTDVAALRDVLENRLSLSIKPISVSEQLPSEFMPGRKTRFGNETLY